MLLRVDRLAVMLALSLAPSAADAACTVSAVTVAFGAYDPRSATADTGTGSVTVACGPAMASTIALSDGGGTSYATRRMVSGAWQLTYQLYSNSGRTVVWGDGTAGTSTVASASTTSRTVTVYGRIPALQNVGAGAYTDSVVVTVTY